MTMDRVYYKGVLYLYKTRISYPEPLPDDFPEEFDLDDFDGKPDLEGMLRAKRQRDVLTTWETSED